MEKMRTTVWQHCWMWLWNKIKQQWHIKAVCLERESGGIIWRCRRRQMYGSDIARSGNNRNGYKHRQTSHTWKIVTETFESGVVACAACYLWMFRSRGWRGFRAAGEAGWAACVFTLEEHKKTVIATFLKVPHFSLDMDEAPPEVGVKATPDRGLCQAFPANLHNRFGSAGSHRHPPPPLEPTHHQVVVGWKLRLSPHLTVHYMRPQIRRRDYKINH